MHILLVLAACNGGGGSNLVQDLTVENGAVPGVVWVSWTSPEPGVGTIQYGKDGVLDHSMKSPSGTEHRVAVLDPQVGQTYTFAVDYVADNGKDGTSEEVELMVEPPGQGTPQFSVLQHDATKTCLDGGHVLMSWLGDGVSGVGILDREGKYVWHRTNDVDDTLISRVRPGRDGKSLLWNYAHGPRTEDLGQVVRMSMDGESTTETRTLWGHHDFVELADGRIAWLGYDFRDLDIVGDVPDVGVTPIVADVLYIDDEGVSDTSSATAVWNFFDDVTTDICDITDRTNTVVRFIPGYYEYTHSNSLVLNETDGSLYVMVRWLDTLFKLDEGGNQVWQWGDLPCDPAGDVSGDPADGIIHAHFSEAWADQLLIFDNHDNPADDPPSMLKQFTVDDSAKTIELDWQYDSDRTELVLGDVRRIPIEGCDNLLVSFSGQGRVAEMTRDGEIVWEVANQLGAAVARVHFLPDLNDFSGVAYPE